MILEGLLAVGDTTRSSLLSLSFSFSLAFSIPLPLCVLSEHWEESPLAAAPPLLIISASISGGKSSSPLSVGVLGGDFCREVILAAGTAGRPSEPISPLPAGSLELPQQLSLSLSPRRSMVLAGGREAAALTPLTSALPLPLPAGSKELPQQLSLSLWPRISIVFATGREAEAAERPGEVMNCLEAGRARAGPPAPSNSCFLVLYGLTRLVI